MIKPREGAFKLHNELPVCWYLWLANILHRPFALHLFDIMPEAPPVDIWVWLPGKVARGCHRYRDQEKAHGISANSAEWIGIAAITLRQEKAARAGLAAVFRNSASATYS